LTPRPTCASAAGAGYDGGRASPTLAQFELDEAAVARAVRAESGDGPPSSEAAATLSPSAAAVSPLSLPALAAELAACWAAHALAASEVSHDTNRSGD
jgi:hypothetical protein